MTMRREVDDPLWQWHGIKGEERRKRNALRRLGYGWLVSGLPPRMPKPDLGGGVLPVMPGWVHDRSWDWRNEARFRTDAAGRDTGYALTKFHQHTFQHLCGRLVSTTRMVRAWRVQLRKLARREALRKRERAG